ncbi:putative rRNA methyltransferase YqxC [uncultured Desulfobacterium sp.]|uniref:Putative rRNA methyltransferase YqxC n=1 Tax=uncultured Desulfobacterium sp. TaxID=201089 RepID=A0A445N247_9BACT|nr:putative rRNA methyltransferase YqxC [uncultured Desulfobacterium sp.]
MTLQKTRLDLLLVQKGLAETREKARALILAGHVMVDGTQADKAGRLVPQSCSIKVKEAPPYVSRGGLKLEAALEQFDVDVAGKVILDVGASTGGFTDCLLKHGAAGVVTVDVGYGQLDFRLRQDARVTVLEKTNIRYLKPEDISEDLHGAVIDVSFISLRLVVPAVSLLLKENAFIIALIKPQFEVGKGKVGKGGVVRDPALHQEVVEGLKAFFQTEGWKVIGIIPSPISGSKGNREFLIYLKT